MGKGESFSVVNCAICSPFFGQGFYEGHLWVGEKLWPWRSWNFLWLAGSSHHVMCHGACWYWMTLGMDWEPCVGAGRLRRAYCVLLFCQN